MQRKALLFSLGLHAVVIGLMFADFHFAKEYTKAPPAILMVDLTKVKIADKTNLPQKAVAKKEQPKSQQKKEEPKPAPKTDKPKQEIKKTEPKPLPKEAPKQKNAVAVQPKKEEKKKEPAKPTPMPKTKQNKPDYNLKSLLASVEKVRQNTPTPPQQDQSAAEALDNGTEGRMDQILTISDRDFIASRLRDCWNIDGGAQDIDEIVVEIKVLVNKDGSIRDAQIMNKMNLPAFRSLSESARRAVYICAQKGDESPFKILANNYADHYNDWKELRLNFNPMNDSVF